MPRYQYKCSECEFLKTYFHGLNDVVEICEKCNKKTMEKVLTNSFFTIKKKSASPEKIGELTKKYIEENREILENEKKEAKEITYEPT